MSKLTLDDIVRDFYAISGMDISIMDSEFRSLAIKRGDSDICSALHRDRNAIEKCKASDIEQLVYVRENLSPIIYYCPYGITEAIIPIVREGDPVGYIISTLGVESADEDKVISLCTKDRNDSPFIENVILNAPKLSQPEIHAYFTMLKMVADYIANDSSLINTTMSVGRLIKKFIKDNISRKLTLNEMAKNLHCSTVTLTEHFKREFGITINEYITKKRMELAERLMISTDKPLREISALCGFADVEYFSRTFKKYHAVSPATWRREKGKKSNVDP